MNRLHLRWLSPTFRVGLIRVLVAVGFTGCKGCEEGMAKDEIPLPTLEAITPGSGIAGTDVPIKLTGTTFTEGSRVNTTDPKIIPDGTKVVSPTEISTTLKIDGSVVAASYQISVTNATGESIKRDFEVRPPAPSLTLIEPGSIPRGAGVVRVTLSGANLTGATDVNAVGIVTTIRTVTATSIQADFAVGFGVTEGSHPVTVTTPSGTSSPNSLSVGTPPAPVLNSISPSSGLNGTTFGVRLTGANFLDPVSAVVTGVGLSGLTVMSPTELKGTLSIPDGLDPVTYTVAVATPFGQSNALPVQGIRPPPTLVFLAPARGIQGTTTVVRLTGTNFPVSGTTVAVSGTGVKIPSLTRNSATQIDAPFEIDAAAPIGFRDVTVTTASGGTSAPVRFEVVAPEPLTLTSISPNGAAFGQKVTVTLVGTGFRAGIGISAGTGIEVSNIVVVDATHVTAQFLIQGTATFGDHKVTVTLGTQVSNAVIFNIV